MPTFPHRTELSIINLPIGDLNTNIIEKIQLVL